MFSSSIRIPLVAVVLVLTVAPLPVVFGVLVARVLMAGQFRLYPLRHGAGLARMAFPQRSAAGLARPGRRVASRNGVYRLRENASIRSSGDSASISAMNSAVNVSAVSKSPMGTTEWVIRSS